MSMNLFCSYSKTVFLDKTCLFLTSALVPLTMVAFGERKGSRGLPQKRWQVGTTLLLLSLFFKLQSSARHKKGKLKKLLPCCAACSSAFMALNDAVVDLQRGRIEYAVVGGSSAAFRPATSIAFGRLK